jgi:DNA polymerase I
MITLIDLGAEFWKNAYGGDEPLRGYELTLERLDWYWRDSRRTVVCVDSPRSARKEKNPAYKGKRKAKPPAAIEALAGVIARITDWGMPVASCDGWEADDVVCTLASQAWPEPVRIIGSEKDFYCLLDERVQLIGRSGPIDVNACRDKFGVAPSQMTDWLALVGDTADNIPGCDCCGPARASDLLERFGSIEAIKSATDEEILSIRGVGAATLAALRAWDPEPALEMIRMRDDLPILLDLPEEDE